MKPRITLVDDDKNILASVAIALEAEGFDVTAFSDSEEALAHICDSPPDLAILDIKMPRLDGREMLKRIRDRSNISVIFLTSLDDEIDQFLGLRMGADDYITKPFSQRLLIERIRTVLRRAQVRQNTQTENTHISTNGSLTMDDDRHLCKWKNHTLDMTVTEYLLIKCLSQKIGHIKSRSQLMDFAYGEGVYVDDRTVDSHIKRIRKKFKSIDDTFDHIETVYGIGYRFKDG